MEDVQRDLARLGVDLATRHNENARCQFEFAPQFTEANLACDQNQLVMETMRKMAREHELRLLFHEKPINFSLEDSEGRNLLKPSTNHRKNVIFLSFLSSFILGTAEHFGLLQASVSTPGNMYRLGGQEAPPNIICIYLGDAIASMLRAVEEGTDDGTMKPSRGTLDLGLSKLPDIVAFDSDRNRTSPIAFTGNKFEFRAPGASQAMAIPVMALLTVWAAGMEKFLGFFEEEINAGLDPVDAAIKTIRKVSEMSRNIRFEGNAYSANWHEEAERRGLLKAKTIPEGIDLFIEPSTIKMLEEMGVFSKKEIEAFHTIKLEQFVKSIEIEMSVLRDMVWEGILYGLPALEKWDKLLVRLATAKLDLIEKTAELAALREKMAQMTTRGHAEEIVKSAVPLMLEIRKIADSVEIFFSSENMPYPNYRNLLSLSA